MKHKVAVIGGGISGITTAITLQLLGYETTCYAKQLVKEDIFDNPLFASQYPAASVIPHSVDTDDLEQLFPASQSVFRQMYALHNFHVSKHRHFELFEFPEEPPAYSDDLLNYSPIQDGREESIPQRKNAKELHGWSFDCYITEWPNYIRQLYQVYRQIGGRIHRQEIERDELTALPAEIVINCAGVGALKLADDPASAQLIRGHLVHLYGQPFIRNNSNQVVSYNYTPGLSDYSTGGEAEDVYFYPINGQWIFGGSRQNGTLDDKGSWHGDEYDDVINVDSKDIPRPIIELNRDILSNSFNVTPDFSASDVRVYIGYRFIRKDAEPSLKVEADEIGDKLFIHNYGHGGAGVTLSWGCALKILQYIKQAGLKITSDRNSGNEMNQNNLQSNLSDVYREYFEG